MGFRSNVCEERTVADTSLSPQIQYAAKNGRFGKRAIATASFLQSALAKLPRDFDVSDQLTVLHYRTVVRAPDDRFVLCHQLRNALLNGAETGLRYYRPFDETSQGI